MAESSSKDPPAALQDLVAQWEKNLNAFANRTMGSDEFSKAINQAMGLSVGVQSSLSEAMGRYLASLNLPSRAEMMSIGGSMACCNARWASRNPMPRPQVPSRRERGVPPVEAGSHDANRRNTGVGAAHPGGGGARHPAEYQGPGIFHLTGAGKTSARYRGIESPPRRGAYAMVAHVARHSHNLERQALRMR